MFRRYLAYSRSRFQYNTDANHRQSHLFRKYNVFINKSVTRPPGSGQVTLCQRFAMLTAVSSAIVIICTKEFCRCSEVSSSAR